MASYPDNLLYYVKKLQGYSRNNVKVLPLTTTKANFGDTVTFRLPTNSLIDLSSWAVHGDLTIKGLDAKAHVRVGRDTASFIRTMQVQIGGQTIQNLDHYNVVWQALKQLTQSPAASACNSYLEWDRPFTCAGPEQTATTAELTAANRMVNLGQPAVKDDNNGLPFVIRNWLGFMASSPAILDTSLTGEIVISLTLDTDARNFAQGTDTVQKVTGGTDTNHTAAFDTQNSFLEKLHSTIDVINIADGVYEMVARQALDSGMLIEIPVPNYYTFGDSAESFQFTSRFTIGCQSLDAAMCLIRRSDRKLQLGSAENGEEFDAVSTATVSHGIHKIVNFNHLTHAMTDFYHIQNGLRFDGTPATTDRGDGWQWEVNGSFVPAYRVPKYDTLYHQKLAFGIHGADHGNLIANNLRNLGFSKDGTMDMDKFIFDRHFIPVVRFSHGSSDKRMLSGIDARSNPVQLAFNSRGGSYAAVTDQGAGYSASSKPDILVVGLCTSTLMLGAGQQLSFSA